MIRSVAVVMRGTVLAQAVGLLALPILARSFSPVAFGHFQVFQSLVGLALVVATLRYEIAILRAETPQELGAVLALCAGINLTIAALMVVAATVYEMIAGDGFGQTFGFSLAYIVIAFVVGGAVQYLGYFIVREEMFSANSNSKVVQALVNAGTALLIALTRPFHTGIVVADIAGRVGAIGAMLVMSMRRLRCDVIMPSRADIKAAMHKFREYPLFAMPGGLVNAAGATLTPIMIYHTFDAATSGQFGLLERSATLPIALIGTSVSQVYMAQLARDLRAGDGDAQRRFSRLLLMLGVISLPPAILLAIFAPVLFLFVFGPGWEQAALFAQLMMPAYFISVLAGSVNMTLIVAGWQKAQFAWEASRLAAMCALWVGGARLSWSVEAIVAGHSAILTAFGAATLVLSGGAIRASTTRGGSDHSEAI